VAHGRATGVVKRLPHGEYVEVHRPLGPAELHTLTEHEHRDRSDHRDLQTADPQPALDGAGVPARHEEPQP
jgi:ubiquinol-cytochrome c reductase cytochrome b subunit